MVIEISNENKSKFLSTITALCFSQYQERVEVEEFVCNKVNQSKGLIYIQDFNILDIDDYDSERKKENDLWDIQKVTWIKTKNTTSTQLLLFKKNNHRDS